MDGDCLSDNTMYMLNKEMAEAYHLATVDTCVMCGVEDVPLNSVSTFERMRFHGAEVVWDLGGLFCDPCYLRARLEGQI